MELYGYRRPDGSVGVRNHVIILPVDDISNAACEAVAAKITGTLALPHAYGRLQYGEDLELHFRTMIGTGANPNVAAAIVIGIEPTWTERIVDGIAATGKPVAGFSIEGQGELEIVRQACSDRDGASSSDASEQQREQIELVGADRQHQVRRVGHDHRPWLVPDGRRGGRPAGRRGRDRLLRRDLRAHRRRAPGRCADARPTRSGRRSSQPTTATSRRSRRVGSTCSARSRPRGTSPAGSRRSRRKRSATSRRRVAARSSASSSPPRRPAAGAGLYFMDTSSAAAECITLMARRRRRRPLVPDRPGERHRQPDRAGDQADRRTR